MRTLPLLLALFSVLPAAAQTPAPEGSGEPPARPHVVLFLADDLGWMDLSYQGGSIPTPNIDSLAEGGVRFSQFYALQICTPSRAALLTGRYPIRYGLQQTVVRPWVDFSLPLDERLLSNALKDAGYRTAICGKWHLGCSKLEHVPTRRGFDHQYGHYLGSIDYFEHSRMEGRDWHRDDEPLEEEGYSTYLIGREAVRLIEDLKPEERLFLFVPFNAPHFPMQGPGDDDPTRENVRVHRSGGDKEKPFPEMVKAMDRAVGWVLEALEEKGMTQDTIVVFVSDNGGVPRQGSTVEPLRGKKNTMYEGGVRVPCAIRWPGVIEPGSTCDAVTHLIDLYPTLVAAAGGSLEQEKPLDGLDLRPLLTEGRPLGRDELLLNINGDRGALRVGDWKIVVDNWLSPDYAIIELYDLANDPSEENDLSREETERTAAMLKRLREYHESAAPALLAGPKPDDFKAPAVWGPRGR